MILPAEVETLIKVIRKINRVDSNFKVTDDPNLIVKKVMFNQGVESVIETLEGVMMGRIKPNEYLQSLSEEE